MQPDPSTANNSSGADGQAGNTPMPDTTPGINSTRNFDSISPSAYSLLLMKGLTSIPYAREAAELLVAPKAYEPDTITRPVLFWARLVHFENRYWSIDQLMRDLPITNILEISSGFSFRGLAWSQHAPVHYIDTDLPELIATKKQFVGALSADDENPAFAAATAAARQYADYKPAAEDTESPTPGHYEVTALNALDTAAFEALVDKFPAGPLLIVNEGLLMYLDQPEKEQLCRNILQALRRRGGYWITADIYIQKDLDPALIDSGDSLHQFLQQHNVEEKKFHDFESAAAFFTGLGFIIDKEAVPDRSKLSALPRLLAASPPDTQRRLGSTAKMQATWRLRPAP